MSDLQEAIFKLNNLMFDAKYLRRRYDNIKKILDTTTDETERKNAQNELQKIFKERDILIKKINDQKEVVRILQEKEKQQQKS
jgi:crotonobetainyl-CoA:carnitine CoA-transferase CaiB-like acyl-CoA transferase